MLPTISLHPLKEEHKKQALIKEKMVGSGFGVSSRTCLNRVDVKVANVHKEDWDAFTVKMTLHMQHNAEEVVTTGHPDWPCVFSVGTSGSGTVTPFDTVQSLGNPTETGFTVLEFVFALNALNTRQQGRDRLFFLRFTLWAHGSPCAQVDTDGFLNKSRKGKLNEAHQRKSIETRDFTATTEHRSKMNQLKRASEALEDQEMRTDALRQRIDQLNSQNRSLLFENGELRRQLQAQPALLGVTGSSRPPAASWFNGGQPMFTLMVPPGTQGGQEVRISTPSGVVTAVVPVGLKPGDFFQVRV